MLLHFSVSAFEGHSCYKGDEFDYPPLHQVKDRDYEFTSGNYANEKRRIVNLGGYAGANDGDGHSGDNEKKLTPQATRRRTGTQLSPSVAAMVAGIQESRAT